MSVAGLLAVRCIAWLDLLCATALGWLYHDVQQTLIPSAAVVAKVSMKWLPAAHLRSTLTEKLPEALDGGCITEEIDLLRRHPFEAAVVFVRMLVEGFSSEGPRRHKA